MPHHIEITHIEPLTHDVKRFTTEKPEGYTFEPGQATEVSIDKPGWSEKKRPFTFTSLPGEDHLEFTIKSYHDHEGVTHMIDSLRPGDGFLIDDAWGAITYTGKGTFIAGGAGVTPFISIFKALKAKDKLDGHRLLFANKTGKDVILEPWFRELLGGDFLSVLSREELKGHAHGHIDKAFLEEHIDDFSQQFYLCGPDKMVEDLKGALKSLGADADGLTFEE